MVWLGISALPPAFMRRDANTQQPEVLVEFRDLPHWLYSDVGPIV